MTTPFSVEKKSNYKFLHAVRLRKSEINSVFCERVLYVGTAPEQKTESAKRWLERSVQATFSINVFLTLFRQEQICDSANPFVTS